MPVGSYEFSKVEADDPNRCQGANGRVGQCIMRAVPGSKYCPSHGGNKAVAAQNEKNKFEYRAGIFQNRLREIAGSDDIKNMRQEAGVLKLLIEEKLVACQTSTDLAIVSGPIGDLTVKLQKLVKEIREYDKECGNTLDKNQLIQFAESFVAIASKYIPDEDDKLNFGSEIAGLLSAPLTVDVLPVPEGQRVIFDDMEEENS